MNKIAIEILVDIAEACENKINTETDINKRELLSRAWAYVTDILENELENGTENITNS